MKQRSLEEVAAAVTRRRRELGITEIRLLKSTGLDRKTVQGLFNGSRWAQEETRLKVEAALQWAAGSIEDIRAGGDPTPLVPTDEPLPLQTATDEELIDEIRRRMKGEHYGMADDTQPNAPSQAGQAQEVRLSDDRQDRSGGIDRDVGGRKHTRVDRAEDREKRNYLPG